MRTRHWLPVALLALALAACESDDAGGTATVSLKNDFDNPEAPFQPPWTICESAYAGVDFGPIGLGETSAAAEVEAGLHHVLLVAAWDDPSCAVENCLPVATAVEEETLPGQERTIALTPTNHRGPCPPEGVAPIPEELYEAIRARWPAYGFRPYAERTENPECQPQS